jgi:hypothetical protein
MADREVKRASEGGVDPHLRESFPGALASTMDAVTDGLLHLVHVPRLDARCAALGAMYLVLVVLEEQLDVPGRNRCYLALALLLRDEGSHAAHDDVVKSRAVRDWDGHSRPGTERRKALLLLTAYIGMRCRRACRTALCLELWPIPGVRRLRLPPLGRRRRRALRRHHRLVSRGLVRHPRTGGGRKRVWESKHVSHLGCGQESSSRHARAPLPLRPTSRRLRRFIRETHFC